MCAKSLEILNRTVLVPTHPLHTAEDAANIIHNIRAAALVALGHAAREEARIRNAEAVDTTKYDTKAVAW